jgi:hypothetical protein
MKRDDSFAPWSAGAPARRDALSLQLFAVEGLRSWQGAY